MTDSTTSSDPVHRVVDVDGIPMSALQVEVEQPQAVILALHGGAVTSRYFDYPDRPRQSLLRTAAALGYTVIALDRPGYGSSYERGDEMDDPARRVDLVYAALDRLLDSRPRGAGVFVLAHSIGCELAARVAADDRGKELLGVELSGTGTQHHDGAVEIMEGWKQDRSWPRRSGRGVRDLIWEPARLYPDEVVGGARIISAGPPYEGYVAEHWAQQFPDVAARVRIPVHFTLGEYERVWRSGPAALADIAALFTASPRVVVEEQAEGGHNLSIGLTSLAYHLKILSFVEECILYSEALFRQG